MKISIVYMTGRHEPRLDWTLDGLTQQATASDDIELVVVDALGRDPGDVGLGPCAPISGVICSMPKPCVWQGPQRVTSRDWWATANARNTGIALASRDYVVFLDDRCALGPEWLERVRVAERTREAVVAGSYEKIEDGRVTADHRRHLQPRGLQDCGGGWLYGCSMAMPLEWCLEVNGFEEGCDGLSGEDYIFGLMLERCGHRIDFDPKMLVRQERSSGTGHTYARMDKGQSPHDKSHAALARFGGRTRTEMTPDLRVLRERLSQGRGWVDVDVSGDHWDWYDGQPIREMEPNP